ncbi:energy-coupling factor transporter ATPase [bacterium]|nr:energy-coupling factor transporter ATPase [bacterium]
MIRFKNVTFDYTALSGRDQRALDNISFSIRPNELVAIAGSAGSGKTTLVQLINGLLRPSLGTVELDSEMLDTSQALEKALRKVGLVFQFPESQFFEDTIGKEIAFGPGNRGWSDAKIRKSVDLSLKRVGFNKSDIKDRSPFQLSGGEKRRIAIASTLAMQTDILILDEPTVGLDRRSATAVEEIIVNEHARGALVIFVTHDMDLIVRLARRVLVLNAGNLVFDGVPRQLFNDAQMLDDTGLEVPPTMQILESLRLGGRKLPANCFCLDDLACFLDQRSNEEIITRE